MIRLDEWIRVITIDEYPDLRRWFINGTVYKYRVKYYASGKMQYVYEFGELTNVIYALYETGSIRGVGYFGADGSIYKQIMVDDEGRSIII